jgi:protein tyrosine phosphatase (PTP) superfamily phosphohydrolase (DUF442 family)
MKKVIGAALVLLTLGFGAGAYFYYFDTYHFAIVQPGVLYRDGFQGMRRFENAYRQRPFKCVINLQSNEDHVQYKEDVAAQREFCKAHGIAWQHIPMKQKTPPTPGQIDEFLKLVRDVKNQPVLAHDSQGVIRMGMMVAVWQKEGMGYDYEQCMSAVKRFGHPESLELTEFIKKLYNKN